jgi:hypothetical protein
MVRFAVPKRLLRELAGLIYIAFITLCIIIARACLQSVTIDEADSFLVFAHQSWIAQWYPSSGNHVLNTLLERLITSIFGVNELTLRTPAILGATIYISAAAYLCARLTTRSLIKIPLFIALVYNPMILDYLVAARGYSLAIGFLLAALAIIASAALAQQAEDGQSLRRKCAWVSVLVALSFAANFSFAVIDGVTISLFFLWTARRWPPMRMAAASFLPGLLVTFVLCGSVVWNWPKGQLYFGSTSLVEMRKGLVSASFDELNPELVNPVLIVWLGKLKPALPWLVALAILAVLGSLEMQRWRSRYSKPPELLTLTRFLAGIALVTLLIHWIAFHTAHLLLPKDRTGLFFVALCALIFGVALSACFQSRPSAPVRWFGAIALTLTAVYFAGCLRLGYFRTWNFDADTKQIYWVLDNLNRRCGITSFVTEWKYPAALNFYRISYGNRSIPEFTRADTSKPLPTDQKAYVLYAPDHEDFIKQQGLQVLYRGERTDATVAVQPCEVPARDQPQR